MCCIWDPPCWRDGTVAVAGPVPPYHQCGPAMGADQLACTGVQLLVAGYSGCLAAILTMSYS